MATTTTTGTTDPAHPSNANSDHTDSSGHKPTTAIAALTDPDFLPTLEAAPATQHAKSHLLLLSLLGGAVVAAWLMGFELLQVSAQHSYMDLGLLLGAAALLWWVGGLAVDWWELVAGYWWLSMPVAGAAGLLLVMAQEQSTAYEEVD